MFPELLMSASREHSVREQSMQCSWQSRVEQGMLRLENLHQTIYRTE
jgi:hypothetical protein